MESCSDQLIENQLSLNLGNTECIRFGPQPKLKPINEFQINCNGHRIKSQNSIRYLGIDIDK